MQPRPDPSDPLGGHGGFVQQFQDMSLDQHSRQDYTPPMHFPPYPPPMQSPYPSSYPSPYLMDAPQFNPNYPPFPPGQQMHPGFPPSAWSSPPMSPNQPYYRVHTRHQSFAEEPPQHYAPPSAYQGFQAKPGFRTANRRSWSGPGREPERERKAYHPQAPANRSDWVMWVGNVPPGASHEELWVFFNQSVPTSGEPWRGPASIFLISRSSCAFVNLSCQEDLDLAVAFFNNKPLRPWDPRCPRLVCRVRKKEDDLRAGVGAQRGTGMHRDWIKSQKEQQQAAAEQAQAQAPADPAPTTPHEVSKHQSSASYASTNSSFLTKNFPVRIFILKSVTKAELEDSVKTGTWKTQKHNEPILDQAFRTASDVFLIFGANKAGEFFGYAKMVEHIDKEKFKKDSQSSKGSATRPEQIREEEDDRQRASSDPPRPTLVLSPSQTRVAASSPGELTPGDEGPERDPKANTDPGRLKSEKYPSPRSNTQPGYFNVTPPDANPADTGPLDVQGDGQVDGQQVDGQQDKDGVLRKDTISAEEKRVDGEELGRSFAIQWIKTGSLPFGRTRHLRNPWNADREVKVSRDGTEVEPTVGLQFIAEWDKLSSARTITPPAGTPTYASVNRA